MQQQKTLHANRSLPDIRALANHRAVQSMILFGSLVVSMGISFIGSMLTTRYLGASGYGDMKFIVTYWYFLDLLVSCGLFHSSGQLLLSEIDPEKIARITGTSLAIAGGMGGILALFTLLTAGMIDRIFKVQMAGVLIALAPFLIVMPVKDCLTLVLQSTNKIFSLAALNVIPPSLFLLGLLLLPEGVSHQLSGVVVLQQATLIGVVVGIVLLLKPGWMRIREWRQAIDPHQKKYGLPVYIGILCAVATQQLNRIAIVYWVDTAAIGFFSLATQIVEPLKMIPGAVATSSFRQFLHQERISPKLKWATLFATGIALLALFVILGKPLEWLFPREFAVQIAPLARAASLGAVVHGFGDLFNRFLGAHGKGRLILTSSIITGLSFVAGFLVLTPNFGVWGALIAQVLGSLIYFLLMLAFYRKARTGKVSAG